MRVISGKARGVNLKTPEGLQTRPTADRVKEAIFSILQFDLPGTRVLDLFGGTGQLGIEALSRGANAAVFVDSSDKACSLIKENLRRCKMENQGQVLRCDYLEYLARNRDSFDIILLDPPYAEVFLEKAINKISEIDILKSGGIIVAERSVEKPFDVNLPAFFRSKDYKYGKTMITIYRKD